MCNDPRVPVSSPPGESGSALEQWRSRVSRWSVAVLLTALGVFLASFALRLPAPFELALPGILAAVVGRWIGLLGQGRCPECAGRIRLERRLILPSQCPTCGCRLP